MKAEAGREQAHEDAGAAREEAAELRGRVEALQAQVAELTGTLAERRDRHSGGVSSSSA